MKGAEFALSLSWWGPSWQRAQLSMHDYKRFHSKTHSRIRGKLSLFLLSSAFMILISLIVVKSPITPRLSLSISIVYVSCTSNHAT